MVKFMPLHHQVGIFYFIKNIGEFLYIVDNSFLLDMEIKIFVFKFLAIILTILPHFLNIYNLFSPAFSIGFSGVIHDNFLSMSCGTSCSHSSRNNLQFYKISYEKIITPKTTVLSCMAAYFSPAIQILV